MLLAHGQQVEQQLTRLGRFLDDQLAAEFVVHAFAVRFTDAHDDARHLRKVGEKAVEQLGEVVVHLALRLGHAAAEFRREGHHVHRQMHPQAAFREDREAAGEFLAVERDALSQLRLQPFVIGQVRHVIERDRVETPRGGLIGEFRQIHPHLRPPCGGFGIARLRHVLPGDLGPVDRAHVMPAKERTDGVDEVERLQAPRMKQTWRGCK